VPHVFEPAASGRSKCRGCGRAIARGELRFGERLPNPFADGEMTVWLHPACAAYKRPEPLLEVLAEPAVAVPDRAALEAIARASLAHRRLPRIDGAERASSGQASCRQCRQPIARGSWRIRLAFYQDGRFAPGGFVHLACREAYFETRDLLAPVLHFSAGLSDGERAALAAALAADDGPDRPG
jgi:hypothetical protein